MNMLEYQINFNNYPKSNNHKITWTKKDNISTCDLNKNCTKIIFKINRNKNNQPDNQPDNQQDSPKIIIEEPLFDKLPKGIQGQNINELFGSLNRPLYFISYDMIFYLLVIIFIIIVILHCKKN